jgi:starch synthase
MGDVGGYGIRFNHATVNDVLYSINRAVNVYQDKDAINTMRTRMMEIDNSWDNSAQRYIDVYESL